MKSCFEGLCCFDNKGRPRSSGVYSTIRSDVSKKKVLDIKSSNIYYIIENGEERAASLSQWANVGGFN